MWSAIYSSLTTTRPSEPLVFAALRILINQHPILSAISLDEYINKPNLARLPKIDLRTCIQFIERNKPFSQTEAGDVELELEEVSETKNQHDWNEYLGTGPF
ncbi:hypothetical protein HRS9139_06702 [Pyrenophora teres f. teres]|nr:hypothetical protein HRS9139_06702 [Pyrenophora teres f. teres]